MDKDIQSRTNTSSTAIPPVFGEKSGELWSTNYADLDVESYPRKSNFSEDHISAPRECCTRKFLHTLKNDKVLLVHSPPWTGFPYNCFQRGSKIGLKFSK